MKRFMKGTIAAVLFVSGFLYAGEEQILKMKIEGMTCGMCEAKVKKQLSSSCTELTVNRKKGEASCKCAEGVTADQVIAECNKTGFKCGRA